MEHGDLTSNFTADTEATGAGFEILFDLKKFLFLTILLICIFPLLPFAISTLYAGFFVLCEPDTTFKQGFLYVASNLLGMSNPLTDYNPSWTLGAVFLDMYVAITALLCFGILLNIINLFEIPYAINHIIESCCCVKNSFVVPFIAIFIFIPLLNAGLCVVFGSILALVEGWSLEDGFLYVFSNTLGLGTPLTEVSPETLKGALLDVVLSSIALGYIAIFADYVTILNPSSAFRKKIRRSLGGKGIIDLETVPELHPLANPRLDDNSAMYQNTNGSIDLERKP